MAVKKKRTKNGQQRAPSPPPSVPKNEVLAFAKKFHEKTPMIFWEKTKIWDWTELAKDDSGQTSTDGLIHNLSNLHIYFKNGEVKDNSRSVALVLKVTMPTQKEFRRLCQKYGYDPERSDTEEA